MGISMGIDEISSDLMYLILMVTSWDFKRIWKVTRKKTGTAIRWEATRIGENPPSDGWWYYDIEHVSENGTSKEAFKQIPVLFLGVSVLEFVVDNVLTWGWVGVVSQFLLTNTSQIFKKTHANGTYDDSLWGFLLCITRKTCWQNVPWF